MAKQAMRGHLYEIDMVRAVTALGVVGVHVTAFTIILTHSPLGEQLQNGAVSALHFTREIFMAITGFVLVYSYANRPFSVKSFWRKRGIGVFLPYVLWSVFYEWQTKPPAPPGPWLLRTLSDILTGSASFQLYYILLTLEFYLVLPWFLRLIVWGGKRPWLLLGVSFALQVVVLIVDYRYVQAGPLTNTGVGFFINAWQSRLLPLYQFYMILGGVGALYMRQLRAFALRYGAWIVAGFAVGLAALWGNFIYQVDIAHRGMGYAISVFQPAMAIYGPTVALFLYWIAYRWAVSRAPQPPRGYRFWLLLSNVSFGIYLVHAYILDQAMAHFVPLLPLYWPEPLRVALVWLVVAGSSTAICAVMLYTPVLSRLVGRPSMLRHDVGIGLRLATLEQHVRLWARGLSQQPQAPLPRMQQAAAQQENVVLMRPDDYARWRGLEATAGSRDE